MFHSTVVSFVLFICNNKYYYSIFIYIEDLGSGKDGGGVSAVSRTFG